MKRTYYQHFAVFLGHAGIYPRYRYLKTFKVDISRSLADVLKSKNKCKL